MINQKKLLIISALTIVLVLVFAGLSFADVPTDNVLELLMDKYQNAAALWSPVLVDYATRIFWILAAIDFVWMAIWLALNPGEFSDLTTSLIRKIIFIGFFWALLTNGINWAKAIVNSLVQAGGMANASAGGTANITPAGVFDTGFDLCVKIFDELSVWSPADSFALVIGAIIIMICFALIAAMMLLIYVQSYIMIYAGVILLGFGGSMFTKDIALKYFQAALAVGVKLFAMILVVGLGQTILDQWIVSFNVTMPQIALFIGTSIVLLALVKAIPDMVGDMINGFSWGAGESLTRSTAQVGKAAIGGAVGAVAGAVGGTMAVREASKLASTTSSGGVASKVGGTMTNLAKAGVQDTAGRLSGQHRDLGTKGGRMSAILKEQRLSSAQKEENKDEPYHSPAPDLSKTGSIYKDDK